MLQVAAHAHVDQVAVAWRHDDIGPRIGDDAFTRPCRGARARELVRVEVEMSWCEPDRCRTHAAVKDASIAAGGPARAAAAHPLVSARLASPAGGKLPVARQCVRQLRGQQ
jgi:hypothetical protein